MTFWIIVIFLLHARSMLILGQAYKAAVVEFSPITPLIPSGFFSYATGPPSSTKQSFIRNVESFEPLIQNAATNNANIIVFPEDAITGGIYEGYRKTHIIGFTESIPEVDEYNPENPCINSLFNERPILKMLSCYARNYNIVLAVNMPDTLLKQRCSTTPSHKCF